MSLALIYHIDLLLYWQIAILRERLWQFAGGNFSLTSYWFGGYYTQPQGAMVGEL